MTTSSPSARRLVDWFARGRDAYTAGQPCHFSDARARPEQRQRWYDGYHHQAALNNRNKRSAEQTAWLIGEIGKIREFIQDL